MLNVRTQATNLYISHEKKKKNMHISNENVYSVGLPKLGCFNFDIHTR